MDAWLRGEREDKKTEDGKKLRGISLEARQELIAVKSVTINTGLRAAELSNLWWPDALREIYLNSYGKAGLEAEGLRRTDNPLNRRAASELREHKLRRVVMRKYISAGSDGRKYGRGLSLLMCRAFKLAGLGAGGLHSLRHTLQPGISRLGGKDLQKLLGHSDFQDGAALFTRRRRTDEKDSGENGKVMRDRTKTGQSGNEHFINN